MYVRKIMTIVASIPQNFRVFVSSRRKRRAVGMDVALDEWVTVIVSCFRYTRDRNKRENLDIKVEIAETIGR